MKVLVILTGLRWRFGLDRRMFDPEPIVECSGHCNPDAIGIDALAERHPRSLSSGERQRVALARALVKRPSLILADEPTGNLDSAHGDEVMRLLRQINAEGTTVVMVTHSPDHAAQASRTLNLLDGRVMVDALQAA